MVLGVSADQLAELRAKDEAAYKAQLASAQWCEWKMTVQTKVHEYKGERRLRHQVSMAAHVGDVMVVRSRRSLVQCVGCDGG